MKNITVSFPGGKRVDAHYDGHTVQTDQSVRNGGEGLAPEPFDLFFVSIATCVGIYVLEFCSVRELNTNGLGVHLRTERKPKERLFSPIIIEISLPHGFPQKHHKAILKTAKFCTVNRHIFTSPEFEVVLANVAEG